MLSERHVEVTRHLMNLKLLKTRDFSYRRNDDLKLKDNYIIDKASKRKLWLNLS